MPQKGLWKNHSGFIEYAGNPLPHQFLPSGFVQNSILLNGITIRFTADLGDNCHFYTTTIFYGDGLDPNWALSQQGQPKPKTFAPIIPKAKELINVLLGTLTQTDLNFLTLTPSLQDLKDAWVIARQKPPLD